jgi:hypothetical protein
VLAAAARHERLVVEQRIHRIARDVRDLRRQLRAALRDRQAAERTLIDEPQLRPPSVNLIRTRRCVSSGASAGRINSCPLMPR